VTTTARSPLLSATAMGEADAIRRLASAGADLNQRMDRTNLRRTPLHLAVVKTQPSSLVALIELGASLDSEDAVGLTPLGWAAHGDRTAMVDFLSRRSRDTWPLFFHGDVERMAEILADDPTRARVRVR